MYETILTPAAGEGVAVAMYCIQAAVNPLSGKLRKSEQHDIWLLVY